MKKFLVLLAILIGGCLFLAGCGGSDSKDDAGTPAPAPTDTAPDANAQFRAVTPSGLALTDKFSIAGRGIVYAVKCNAIAGAVSYVFTTSFGGSESVAAPQAEFLKPGADAPFTLSVYAINSGGHNTKTASANLN